MATVTAMTAARMLAIEAESITGARVDAATFHLILTRHDGTEIDAGDIQGPVGPMNPNAADLSDVGPQEFLGQLTLHAGMKIPSGQNVYFDDSGGDRITADGLNLYVVFNPTGTLYFHNGASIVGHIDQAGGMIMNGSMKAGDNSYFGAGSLNNNATAVALGGFGDATSAYVWASGSGTSANVNLVLRPQGTGQVAAQDSAGGHSTILNDGLGNMLIAGSTLYIKGAGGAIISMPTNSMTFQDGNGHSFLGAYDDGNGLGTNLYTIRGGAVGNMLDDGAGHIRATAQIYPGSEGLAGQTSGGLLHAAGVPSNANGNNNDWCISDNGHLYFKAAGAWVQKI